jgi:hypothetical protein
LYKIRRNHFTFNENYGYNEIAKIYFKSRRNESMKKKSLRKRIVCVTTALTLMVVTSIFVHAEIVSPTKVEKSAQEAGVGVHPVPASWNPLTTSSEELEYYCYPPRPSDPQQEKEWEKVVMGGKWFEPRFTESERHGSAAKKTTRSTNSAQDNNTIWGGVETHQYAERVTGYWTMPWASADTSHRPAYSSTWIGIGGDNGSTKLIQAGTESSILASGAGQYAVWWEILGTSINNAQQNISNFTFWPGDQFYCDISIRSNYPSSGTGRASFYIKDVTSGALSSFYKDITNYSGVTNCAEWITERPIEGGTQAANFANVGQVHMWNCGSSTTYNGSVTLIDNASGYIWYEYLNSQNYSHYLGTPATIGSTGNFIFSWLAYN